MRISLFFPPRARLVGPCLSLPSLTASLREHGHTVIQRDLNIEAHETLLTPSHFLQAERVLDRKLASIDQQAVSSDKERYRWGYLVRAKLSIPYTAAHIEEAKSVLRDDVAFYDFSRYLWSTRVVKHGLSIVNAEFEPRIFPVQGEFAEIFASWTVSELLEASHDEMGNSFLSYLRDQATPSILAECPDLVGISITYHTQILPGLTLARLLREAQPNLPIYLGGAILSEIADVLLRNEVLFEIVNGFVVGEGETALLTLADAHEKSASLAKVPNLVYTDEQENVLCNNLGFVEDLSTLPTPDYEGLPLDKYLSPHRLGYLASSRGCYWNRCAFCTSPNALGRNGYRQRRLEQVAEDMLRLRERHGMELFFFCDDCFAPRRMARLAEWLIAAQAPVQWIAETRLDGQLTPELCALLARGGCKHLVFGLESASQRVLDLMDKGVKIDVVSDILHNCYQVGIGAVLMTFVNFPTETREEAEATVDFLAKVSPIISFATLSCFMLMKGSAVAASPEKFGIHTVHRPAANKLAYIYDYELEDGTRSQELEPVFWRASSQLDGIYPIERDMFHLIHFFLHTTQRGTINLGDLHLQKKMGSDTLNFVPRLPTSVTQHHFRKNGVSLHIAFDQASGEMWNLTTRESELLAVCDGHFSSKDILDRLAGQVTGMERIKRWFRDLETLRGLLEKGIFCNGYEDHIAVPSGGGSLPALSEPAYTDSVS